MQESKKTLTDFLTDVEPKYVTLYLSKTNAISLEDETYILFDSNYAKISSREKLVSKLLENGPRSVTEFLAHLDEFYPWVKLPIDNWLNEELKFKLDIGYVPITQICEVERPKIVKRIIKTLITASFADKPQWVVIPSMVGSGKSVIAAQALRNFKLNELYFPDGILWLPIGNIPEADSNALLLKLQELCAHFGENKPETIASAKRFLKLQARNKPKFLLVLDDVWDGHIIKTFTIGWTILVTTRDQTKFNSRNKAMTLIEMPKGFTWEETKNHLSQWIYTAPEQLHKVAETLHKKYNGLPIMMTIIGSMMSDFGNDHDRWNATLAELENGKIARIRHHSGQVDLSKEIRMIVHSLDRDLKECFMDFLLFCDDFYIPCKVFEVLWGKNHMQVEDLMNELVKKSLIHKMRDEDAKHERYGIHDLFLMFLKEEYKAIQKERHQKLVNKYLLLCKKSDGTYDYGLLPSDNYIHIFLAYHLVKADMCYCFPVIFFDLNFLKSKIKITGPNDYIHDLVTYKDHYKGHGTTHRDFMDFIRHNGHVLCNRGVDVLQLALNELPSSIVHTKALQLISQLSLRIDSTRLYFDYCNRSCNYNSIVLSTKPHANNVTCVVFSPCNSLVASCGDDNLVKIWDCGSGKHLHQFCGHEDTVTCCAFSPDSRYIVSSSLDGTVRIWSTEHLKSIIESCSSPATPRPRSGTFIFSDTANYAENCLIIFSQHSGAVTSCAFSNDTEMIASGGDDGIVLVWDPSNGQVKYELRNHESSSQVNHCCFSPDNRYVASCSCDSYVVLYDTHTGQIFQRLFHDDKSVDACQFRSDGQSLISASGHYVWKWNILDATTTFKYNNLKTEYHVKCIAFSRDEKKIIGGTSERAVVIWTERNGSIEASYKLHSTMVNSLDIAKDGSKLISASEDGTVLIYDMNVNNNMSSVCLIPEFSVRFKNNVPVVAAIEECNKIRINKGFSAEKIYQSQNAENEDLTCCCLSPDCSKLLYGTKSGSAYILDVKTDVRTVFDAHCSSVSYCLFLNEGTKFITASTEGCIILWESIELDHSGNFKPMNAHKDAVIKCCYYVSKDGARLLSCSKDGLLILCNVQTCQTLLTMVHKDTVSSCDVSQDQKLFASTCVDKLARIWDAQDGKLLHQISFTSCVRSCQFSPNSEHLAAGDDEGVIKIFNVLKPLKKACQELQGHSGFVNDIVWCDDSRQFVSVADEICWWDLERQEPLQTFIVKGKRMLHIFSSNDFKVFVTIDANGILYILKQIDSSN